MRISEMERLFDHGATIKQIADLAGIDAYEVTFALWENFGACEFKPMSDAEYLKREIYYEREANNETIRG